MRVLALLLLALPCLAQEQSSNSLDALTGVPVYEIERVGDAIPRVGDTIELKITGLNLPGVEIATTDLVIAPVKQGEDLGAAGWMLQGMPEKKEEIAATEFRFAVTVLRPGRLTLQPMKLSSKATQEAPPLAKTAPFELEVKSAISPDDPKPKEPEGVRPPATLPFPRNFAIAVGVLALLLVALAIYGLKRWSSRQKSVVIEAPPEPAKPEHEIALAALEELERQKFAESRKFKPLYFGVSDILKNYAGSRFGFDGLECTTEELFTKLQDNGRPQAVAALRLAFDKLDRVKFSDHIPEQGEPVELIASARKFIQETKRAI